METSLNHLKGTLPSQAASRTLTLISTSVLWDFSVFSAWECSLSLVMFLTTCEDGGGAKSQSPRCDGTGISIAGTRSGVHLTCLKASPSFSFPAFCASFSRAAALLALFFTLIRQDSRHTSRRKTSRPSKAMMVTYRVSSLYASGKMGGKKTQKNQDHK